MFAAPWAVAEDMVEERRVGRSRMSEMRSTFLAIRRAFFRRSRTSFSVLRLYFSEKDTVWESSLGMSLRRLWAWDASWGRVERRLERWSEEATRAELDLAERDWMERRFECDDWAKDCGSVDVRDAKGSVEMRFRYFAVTLSLTLGTGREVVGLSKYGAKSSYKGSAISVCDHVEVRDGYQA